VVSGTAHLRQSRKLEVRALTFGLLTFYFIRAGSLLSIPEFITASLAFLFLLIANVIIKIVGVYPVADLSRGIIEQAQYSTHSCRECQHRDSNGHRERVDLSGECTTTLSFRPE
jgi:hypothetical protein